MMKNVFFALILLFFFTACLSDKLNDDIEITAALIDPENPPKIEFSELIFNFDTVALGEEVEHTFEFKNTGETPLLINSVKAGCGCTVLKGWPKNPISSGGVGEIPIVFTPNRAGHTKKYISILANTNPATNTLYIEGQVVGTNN